MTRTIIIIIASSNCIPKDAKALVVIPIFIIYLSLYAYTTLSFYKMMQLIKRSKLKLKIIQVLSAGNETLHFKLFSDQKLETNRPKKKKKQNKTEQNRARKQHTSQSST